MVMVMLSLWFLATAREPQTHPGEGFACNLNALNKTERARHHEISRSLFGAVQEQTELPDGFAFRLPRKSLPMVAEWVALESRCCPFFSFGVDLARDNGPLWLRITGPGGAKEFMRLEMGL